MYRGLENGTLIATKISLQVTRAKIKDKLVTENAPCKITDSLCSIFLVNHIEKSSVTKIGTGSD